MSSKRPFDNNRDHSSPKKPKLDQPEITPLAPSDVHNYAEFERNAALGLLAFNQRSPEEKQKWLKDKNLGQGFKNRHSDRKTCNKFNLHGYIRCYLFYIIHLNISTPYRIQYYSVTLTLINIEEITVRIYAFKSEPLCFSIMLYISE